MARKSGTGPSPNVFFVVQAGRLEYEAVIFTASFRAANPDFKGRLLAMEPTGARWSRPVKISDPVRAFLTENGVEILPFENRHFGESYPHGNKIEAMTALPEGPFAFFDTDTVFLGPLSSVGFDFNRPAASMRREGTWPEPPLYKVGYREIWKSLYDKFDLDFESSLDLSQPDEYWRRYLYFNAGWFFGADAPSFGKRFLHYAHAIRWDTPEELASQSLDPWLDQVALPLVIHSFGGGRPGPELDGLDGAVSCHYRALPLLYARESDAAVAALETAVMPQKVKKILRLHEPAKKLIYQGKGMKLRAKFDRDDLPKREQVIRNTIKRAGLWLR
ncbi:hypothetical protein C8J27_102284 [Rhodobacter aestuarii]|uniref:Glycosyl transferase family 8 n=1 Tax=Rhodobacter aestuarii TaxID=453582 RepID=A0A1N7MWB1_9RHOB|nr:hypothetical protein [Rhodobacter aestuarii]PTV96487.1 hypothetical protein C8J27_102284 [Rhodobacter aestuarii]SIS90360.1 hypothetical protein SAMN05421580_106237 [Rhodobacter aestuarii]